MKIERDKMGMRKRMKCPVCKKIRYGNKKKNVMVCVTFVLENIKQEKRR